MFWGIILKPNKRYSQTVQKSFHVSQACLDTSSSNDSEVQVMLTSENENFLLCTLQKGKSNQSMLDLNFAEGDVIGFSAKGSGTVHLTGFLVPGDDFFGNGPMGSDEEDEEENAGNVSMEQALKMAMKKQMKGIAAGGDDDDSDSDDDDFQMADLDSDAEDGAEEDDDEDAEEEDDDDNDEEASDDDAESEEEEEVVEPQAKKGKLDVKDKKGKQNGLENGKPVATKKEKKEQAVQPQKKSPKKTVQGGVIIEDLKVGSGPEAKSGKKIAVYYEGKLKSNNKTFDSTKQGAGFKFNLGRGDVIRAWDVGVAGMKVGGKRRIECPPSMAYGAKGSPPVIPGNATLVFDVELKNVF